MLGDLGISEARLQNSLVEVWNKADLLPSHAVAAGVLDGQTGAAAEKLSQSDDDTPGMDWSRYQDEVAKWCCCVALLA